MAETSLFWSGTTTGDATSAPYDDDEFSDVLRDIVTYDRLTECVIYTSLSSYTGLLEVTNPAGTTVRVATGVALVDGKLYRNSANIDFTAGVGSQYYRVVLRKDFTAQTVRAVLLGPSGSVPATTNTDGTTWEVPLATIYTSSPITITDERSYINKVVSASQLASGVVTTSSLANASVDDTKAGARVAIVPKRVGGSATHWSVAGSNVYTPTMVYIQCGVVAVPFNGPGGGYGTAAITFPTSFSNNPIVIATPLQSNVGVAGSVPVAYVHYGSLVPSGCTIGVRAVDEANYGTSTTQTWDVAWMAIGTI